MILRRGQILLILFSIWILAITLPGVHFTPGNWEAIKQGLAGKPPSLEILLGIILALAAIFLAGLVLLLLKGSRRRRKGDDSYEIYREPVPVPWSVYAIIVLLFAALAGLVWWVRQPSTITEQQAATRPFAAPPQEKAKKVSRAAPPEGLPYQGLPESRMVEYIAAIGFLAGLSWVAWRVLKGRPPKEEVEAADLGRIIARAAMDLEKGAELSDIVLRCYRDMCAILGRKVALRKEMTAREFAQRLQQAGVGEEEVLRLTALFERVRYGRHVAGPDERAEAIVLLQAVERKYGKVADED